MLNWCMSISEVSPFFSHAREPLSDESYKEFGICSDILASVSRVCYPSFYVVDYYRHNFFYVSDNPLFLGGKPAEEVMRLGYEYFLEQIHPEDYGVMIAVKKSAIQFLHGLPPETWTRYTLSLNIRMRDGYGGYIMTNHRWTPMRLSPDNHLWLSFCAVTLAVDSHSSDAYISSLHNDRRWIPRDGYEGWDMVDKVRLKSDEVHLIKLAAQGLTMDDMACRLNKSVDSVKKYRKALFKKLGVNSMNEAIVFAMTYQLL